VTKDFDFFLDAAGDVSDHAMGAYQDGVAALLTDPELADEAANALAKLADRRCLPRLVDRVNRVTRRCCCGPRPPRSWTGRAGHRTRRSHQVSMFRRVSPEMLAQLRILASKSTVRVRQHAQWALLASGDHE
jgi:hypothetical protein